MIDIDGLIALQAASYRRASGALSEAWPESSAMDAAELGAFLDAKRYCVFATTRADGHAEARPVAFVVLGTSLWFATVAGGRLTNLRRTPWASVVIEDGEGDNHRAVVVDGPIAIVASPPPEAVDAWQARLGSRGEWARAWLELRPARVASHVATPR